MVKAEETEHKSKAISVDLGGGALVAVVVAALYCCACHLVIASSSRWSWTLSRALSLDE